MTAKPRVSDERLAIACHPSEAAISPMWSNAQVHSYDLALDLRDERAESARLRAELREVILDVNAAIKKLQRELDGR